MASPSRVRMTAKVISETKAHLKACLFGSIHDQGQLGVASYCGHQRDTPSQITSVISAFLSFIFLTLLSPHLFPWPFLSFYVGAFAQTVRTFEAVWPGVGSDRFPLQLRSLPCGQEKFREAAACTAALSGVRKSTSFILCHLRCKI